MKFPFKYTLIICTIFLIIPELSGQEKSESRDRLEELTRRIIQLESEISKMEKDVVVAEEEIRSARVNRWNTLWRSAILPGSGQSYAGHDNWGMGAMVTTFTSLAYVASSRNVYQAAKNDYNATNPANFFLLNMMYHSYGSTYGLVFLEFSARPYTEDLKESYEVYNNSLAIFSVVYIAQLMQAWYMGKAWEENKDMGLQFSESAVQLDIAVVPDSRRLEPYTDSAAKKANLSFTMRF